VGFADWFSSIGVAVSDCVYAARTRRTPAIHRLGHGLRQPEFYDARLPDNSPDRNFSQYVQGMVVDTVVRFGVPATTNYQELSPNQNQVGCLFEV
jgi:hypothetical protein